MDSNRVSRPGFLGDYKWNTGAAAPGTNRTGCWRAASIRALPPARLRTGARRVLRSGQPAWRTHSDCPLGATHRRRVPAERLVGPRHPNLGVPAVGSILVEKLRYLGVAMGDHLGGTGAISLCRPTASSRG